MFSFFFLLIALTVLSAFPRMGHFNLLGASIVLTDSMEPVLRPGDMVLYYNTNYTVGDIVVYCITPSHCVVHRVVNVFPLDTVNGNELMIVTKGDNVDVADSPVSKELVRGRVICSVPRELWIPLVLAMLTWVFYDLLKNVKVLGCSYAILLLIGTLSLIAVYATAPKPLSPEVPRPPLVNLAGIYFDNMACTVRVAYTDGLYLSHVDVEVNNTAVDTITIHAREIVLKPSSDSLRHAFETGNPLLIQVNASLNNIGWLKGEYTLLIGGEDPFVSPLTEAVLIRNNNCFPITLNISVRYISAGTWYWSNQTIVLDGFSYLTLRPPDGVDSAYAYIYWSRQGDPRWVGIKLK